MFAEFTIFLFTVLKPLNQASTQKHQYQLLHCTSHWLHICTSCVLTVTGIVNGNTQFSTHHRNDIPELSPKNLAQVIISATRNSVPNLV